jgi:hypothetical protein
MGHRSRKAMESPARHDVKSAPMRVGHQAIELRTFLFSSQRFRRPRTPR